MGHGVPIATTGVDSCGVTGPFFLEAGLCSTSQIARFWGLDTAEAREWRSATRSGDGRKSPAPSLPALPAGDYALADDIPLHKHAGSRDTHSALDPNAVIAAAFKAAGLPAPEETGQPGSRRVDPGGIIAAALKAAGLTRS
jgi:hypothetical protein